MTEMRRKIFSNIILLSALSTVIVTLISIMASYKALEQNTMTSLASQAQTLARGIATFGWENYRALLETQPDNIRVTIIDQSGEVLLDTSADIKNLENHSNRPEIQDAKKHGSGFAKRYSTTLAYQTFYSAILINDQIVLRLATDVQTVFNMIAKMIPYFLSSFLIVFIISYILSNRLTDNLLQPIKKLTASLSKPIDYTKLIIYDEILPLVQTINQQQFAIQNQIEALENERDTISLISNNMREGLILLDQNAKVLACNQSAAMILDVQAHQFIGKNFIHLTRNPELNRCVTHILANENVDTIIELEGKYYHIYGCGVKENNKIVGGMLLLVDVTTEQLAQKMRTEFTANVSHELRTPITSISGYAELLTHGMVAEKDIPEFAGRIYQEASRMKELINDLITLGKLDEKSMNLQKVNTELSGIVKSVFQRLQKTAEQAQVELRQTGTAVYLITVPSMIEELIYNLVENAIKYNKAQGAVTVSLSQKNEQVKISVIDTGVGIPKSAQPRIFERFYRVDQSRSNRISGTGLGLAIVKHIVQTLDGDIFVQSQENQGTQITVTFNQN